MGSVLSSGKKKKVKIVCCGLDNSGKTTIINSLKAKKAQVADVTPTVGFSVEEFEKENLLFSVFDMSGQGKFRNLWESFYDDINAVVFVIDAADRVRMTVAKNELDLLLEKEKKNIPILFFANKQDIQGSLSAQECSDVMGLGEIKDRSFNIVGTNALKNTGIDVGVKWLSGELNKKQ
ncbi:ADP-ribosylation factor-like protein [Acrasis kona]|uniref:ADP-ribosylation factor-like protein n=1 Tax=Acrasis kona TaxID=1008807 RepID=A0AAW2Z483_9EUKA